MSFLSKQNMPKMIAILILLFAIAVTADATLQVTSLNVTPTFQLSSYDGDIGESEHHAQKVAKYLSICENEVQLKCFVIRYYLKQVKGYHIPPSPSIFFRPDRAPPVLFS